jgi:hypothetical protein
MAKTFQESYIDVERAYSQTQFQQALSQAETLLTDRPADADDLQYTRLQLLTGHIHLYGLNQPEKAATYYNQVVESSQEPTYRDLARQGLELCSGERSRAAAEDPTPAGSVPAVNPPFLATAMATASGDLPAGAPAMPWLEGSSAALADREEVELIDLPEEETAPSGADPTIVEATFIETPEPQAEVDPSPASAFSVDERAQLAKGRLRVILR